jgi:hypothetical protein
VPAYLLVTEPGAVAVTLRVTAGGVKVEPPVIGPGTVSTTLLPTRAVEPETVPPDVLAETYVEFAGTGMSIFRLLILVTVKMDSTVDGTVDEPGVRVMATGEPAVTEPGAVLVTEVVMLDVWPTPEIVPLQLQFTLTAAFAVPAKQSAATSATGVTAPARSSVDVFDRIVISKR